MRDKRFYEFLHRQIPVLIALSLVPGLGYVLLAWLNGVFMPAAVWYGLIVALSLRGWQLYRGVDFDTMSERRRERWYRDCSRFVYAFFVLWMLIFLLYVGQRVHKLHYIAIFTEIGASVVASALLASDRRLFRPTIYIMMVPLIIYFALIGEWYGYVLTAFAITLNWVLLYSAGSTHELLQRATRQATRDALTALCNREYFIDYLQQRMNTLSESGEYSYLLLIDLDHFKKINDSLGHDVGDRLLQIVSNRLQLNVPQHSVVARLGGDEFIIAGDHFPNRDACERMALEVAERLITALKAPYLVEPHHLHISASIGVSLVSGRDANANRFIKEADIAMYEVKAKGRDGVFMFNDEMSERVESNLQIERELHFALAHAQIALHYQPQLDCEGRIVGVESLARWTHPVLGPISPDRFIPIAEQTGLIVDLGAHILETGFTTLRTWHDSDIALEQFSINISMRQFTHHGFVAQVEALAARLLTGDLIRKVVFEITESVVAEDVQRVIAVMKRLKASGIRFSMDDFGTGYSSLSYLNRLPLDEIKIDRAFVGALGQDEGDRAMVVTILNLARILNLNIVAEGVETAEQRQFLMDHGCRIFQGYYYSEPLAAPQFEAYYRNRRQAATAAA